LRKLQNRTPEELKPTVLKHLKIKIIKLKKDLKSYLIPSLIAQSSLPPAAGYKTLAAEPTVYLNINQSINQLKHF